MLTNDRAEKADELLTLQEVAAMLRVTDSTLYARRARRQEPHGFRLGGTIRYKRSTVEEYIRRQEQAETEAFQRLRP